MRRPSSFNSDTFYILLSITDVYFIRFMTCSDVGDVRVSDPNLGSKRETSTHQKWRGPQTKDETLYFIYSWLEVYIYSLVYSS